MIVVIGIAAYSYLDSEAFRNAAARAERSRSIVEETQELLSRLKDTQISQTAYLLTGDVRDLSAYSQSLSKIASAQQVLSQPQAADPEDRERLSTLITARLDELAQAVRFRQQGDAAFAIARA